PPSPVLRVRFMGLQHDPVHHWRGRTMDVSTPRGRTQPLWEAEIFADSYALIARQRGVPIGFVTVDGGGGLLDSELRAATVFPVDDTALHDYEHRLRAAADAAHVSIAFREFRPGPVALAATVRAARPARFLSDYFGPFESLWRAFPKGLLGFSLVIRDGKGSTAAEGGWWPNAGGGYVRPDLRGCTSFFTPTGPYTGSQTQPCPV